MASSSLYVIPDSTSDAQELLYESLRLENDCERAKVNLETANAILHKYPDLVNCEYKKKNGFQGSPLLIACERYADGYGKSILTFM